MAADTPISNANQAPAIGKDEDDAQAGADAGAEAEAEALLKELDSLESDIQKLMEEAANNPNADSVQALFEVIQSLDETSDLLDTLDTSALESRLNTLSQPVEFTQTRSDVYQVDESLALASDTEEETPSKDFTGQIEVVEQKPEPADKDQATSSQDESAGFGPPGSAAPESSISYEEVKTEPANYTTAPQVQPNDDTTTDPTFEMAPQPKFSYMTPSKPVFIDEIKVTPVNPDKGSADNAPRFRSILVPVIADLNKLHPTNYRVPVTVGNKTFFPILDTGSSLLWVPAKMTTSDSFPPHLQVYEAEKLKRRMDSIPIVYGADTVEYRAVIDTCYLGDVGVDKFRFGGAFGEIFENAEKKHLTQGILGISPSPPAVVKDGTIISDRANMIQCLEGKIYRTVCTLIGPKFNPKLADKVEQKGDNQGRGFLAVGELSRDFFSGEMAWCPNLVRDKWVVELDKVIINGKEMTPRRRTALIDTGTSYVCAPERDFDELSSMLDGHPLADASPFFSVPKEKMTEVSFVLGGRKLPLRDDDMYLGQAGDLTKHAPHPEEYVCSIVRKPGASRGDDFMDYWVLGGIFLDNGVTSFAYSPFGAISSVGFADIPETDLENWEGKAPDPWDTSYSGGFFKR